MLGTAAAVAGGMVAGNAVTGAVQAAQLEAAFADLEAGLQASEEALLAGLDTSLPDAAGDDDLDFEI